MKVWRAELTALASRNGGLVRALDLGVRGAAPLLLLLVCLFVTVHVVKSEMVVSKIGDARRVEGKLSSTFISVHTIKSRELEYLLTGQHRYLERVERDLRGERQFRGSEPPVRQRSGPNARLVSYRATAEDLLGTMNQAISHFQAGDTEGVRDAVLARLLRLMDDNSIGSGDLLKIERARIANLQETHPRDHLQPGRHVRASGRGAFVLRLRLALMSRHVRRQRLTLRTLERAKASAEEARIAAEEASRAKSDFLASVSHELRTPLNAILGFSELIDFQMLGPVGNRRYAEYAADIHKSGRHLLELVNDILDLSKIGARQDGIARKRIFRRRPGLGLRRASGRQGASHLAFEKDIAPDLPALWADFKLIKQILLNLLSNAAKFTPEGGRVTIGAIVGKAATGSFSPSPTPASA